MMNFPKAKGKMQSSKIDALYNEIWSLEDRKKETLKELRGINSRLHKLRIEVKR